MAALVTAGYELVDLMTRIRPILLSVLAGLVVYAVIFGFGRIFNADRGKEGDISDALVSPTLAPTKLVPRGAKTSAKVSAKISGTGLTPTLTPVLALTHAVSPTLAPTQSPTVVPTLSHSPTPVPYTTLTPTPTTTTTPTPTPSRTLTPSVTPSPTPVITPTPSPSQVPTTTTSSTVIINEIGWMGTTTSANDEWIELYNSSDADIDVSNWTIWAQDTSPKITLSGIIAAHEYYLLERTSDTTISDIAADLIYTGSLENGGEVLELRDAGGQLRDSVDAWYGGDNTTKSTMERVNMTSSGNVAGSWATNNDSVTAGHDASGQPIRGTPRSKNSVTP